MYRSNNCRGFTLMEVMVALAVFAAAAGLLLVSDGNSTRHTRYLAERVEATQLAENHLNAWLAGVHDLNLGEHVHTLEHRQQLWYLREQVSTTSQSHFYRVEVSVYKDSGSSAEAPAKSVPALASLTTFVQKAGS